jgi:hypothetical protein
MEECPICLSPLNGTVTTVGCCKKQFHTGCILKCVQRKNECPMCRVRDCIVLELEPEPEPELPSHRKRAVVFFGTTLVTVIIYLTIKNYAFM